MQTWGIKAPGTGVTHIETHRGAGLTAGVEFWHLRIGGGAMLTQDEVLEDLKNRDETLQ